MKTLEVTNNAWIGLSYSAQEGNWRWDNGDNALITDWGLNQPDGGVLQNCTVMNISDTFRWHDLPCSSTNDYVCEKGIKWYLSVRVFILLSLSKRLSENLNFWTR